MDNTQTLIASIEAFDIDGGPVQTSFADRLAQEQGWTPEFTRRVIREYKRFVALAMISKTPVTPSLIVDEAWHLHLIYTRSYWERFTPMLPRPLHHEPTKGGEAENTKHKNQFSSTLELYRQTFGEEAPADIWRSKLTEKSEPTRTKNPSTFRLGVLVGASALALVGCTAIAQTAAPASIAPFLVIGGIVIIVLIIAAATADQQRRRNGGQCSSSGGGCSSATGGGCSSSTSHGGSSGHGHGGHCGGGGHCSGGHGGDGGGSGGDGGGGDGGGSCGGGGCGGCGS